LYNSTSLAYPPCFLEQPYQLRVCLSYCDTRVHQGTIYRASGFALARQNNQGIETWMNPAATHCRAGHQGAATGTALAAVAVASSAAGAGRVQAVSAVVRNW